MAITLYELAGADETLLFSPYCWRVRLALRHKGLDFHSIPWRFTEKDRIAFSGQTKVPVLTDGDKVVVDSWSIAEYLEDAYPEGPHLFGGTEAKGTARFVTDWVDSMVMPALFRQVVIDIPGKLHEMDLDYFRASREQRVGMSLEAFSADRAQHLGDLRKTLTPLRNCLARQPFVAGDRAAWADYAVFGAFQWARVISPVSVIEIDDPIYGWREKMLDAFDGAARSVPAAS